MPKKSKQNFLSRAKVVKYGTFVFIVIMVLMIGLFLFPRVRTIMHGSAVDGGMLAGNVLSSEVPGADVFKDVSSNHPNAQALQYLKDNRIVKGYSDGTFKPENFVTRAELLKFLFDTQKVYPSPAVYRACFKDVKDQWFAPDVCYAKAKGLVKGFDNGNFDPDSKVTVIEALKIVLLGYNANILQSSPTDSMNLEYTQWYTSYVWTAFSKELITWGSSVQPELVPNLTADNLAEVMLKRGQLAEILYRMIR